VVQANHVPGHFRYRHQLPEYAPSCETRK
jgi:hypothetical protein